MSTHATITYNNVSSTRASAPSLSTGFTVCTATFLRQGSYLLLPALDTLQWLCYSRSLVRTELDSEPQAEAAALGPRAMAAPSVVECALGGPTKLSTLLWAGYAQRVLLHDTCWTHVQKFKQKECGPWGSGGVEIFLSLPLIAGPGRTPVVQFFCVHFFSHSSKDQGEP